MVPGLKDLVNGFVFILYLNASADSHIIEKRKYFLARMDKNYVLWLNLGLPLNEKHNYGRRNRDTSKGKARRRPECT